jgi:hypothetical protein
MSRRKRFKKWFWLVLGLFVAAFVADYYLYPWGAPVGGQSFDQGANGLWLRYTWYFEQHSDSEVSELADKLIDNHFRYAFFHVRYIERDGALKFRYAENARSLVTRLKTKAPQVRSLAWIYAGNKDGRGEVDLADQAVRVKMVEQAAWLVRECGFEGVQWDYEVCRDGDRDYLKLLEETRAALPKGAFLSVAAHNLFPPPLSRFGWSEAYYSEIASRCDQIAVMGYDSGFVTPRSYSWLLKREASILPEAVGDCELLIGVPTYGPAGLSHNCRAENLEYALRALRQVPQNRPPTGVALFADYTTDQRDWETYRRLWLRN